MKYTLPLRIATLVMVAIGTAFWLYTFYHISNLPAGDGTGFQWLAEVPLTGIFGVLIVPALVLTISDRATPLAAALAASGLLAFFLLWRQLLTEFAP